jgi:dTDP-4-dehydrorhamnose 3,5-epimerase-like enzyme
MKGLKATKLQEINSNGSIIVSEIKKNFDFLSQRFFFVKGKKNDIRGNHAHKNQKQFMVCITGSVILKFNDGLKDEEVALNNPLIGIEVAPLIWGTQTYLEDNTILMVLCDQIYDESDYIRDYCQFKKYLELKIR